MAEVSDSAFFAMMLKFFPDKPEIALLMNVAPSYRITMLYRPVQVKSIPQSSQFAQDCYGEGK